MDSDREKSVAEIRQWLTLIMAGCVINNEHEYPRAKEKFGEEKLIHLVNAINIVNLQDPIKYAATLAVVNEEVILKNKSITSKCMAEAFELAAGVVYKGKL